MGRAHTGFVNAEWVRAPPGAPPPPPNPEKTHDPMRCLRFSTIIGLFVAAISALVTKYCDMRSHSDLLFLELCILCTFPYIAFMLAEGFRLSGIVSILFCGIGMSHYTYNNLSEDAQESSRKVRYLSTGARIVESCADEGFYREKATNSVRPFMQFSNAITP